MMYIEYVLKCMCWKYGELNIIYQPFFRNTYQAIQSGRSKTLEVAETNERVTKHHPKEGHSEYLSEGSKAISIFP